jgi:flagellar biosynthesis protein FlhG
LVSLGGSDQAEGLRRLLARHPARVLGVVGSEPGVGQSTLSWQLSCALQAVGQTVLWVNARPSVERGHPPRQRFLNPNSNSAEIWECVLGRARSEALSPPLRAWIQSRRTDWVILDTPPIDGQRLDVLWHLVEHVIFVSRPSSVAMKPLLTIAKTLHHALALTDFRLVMNGILNDRSEDHSALSAALSASMKAYLQLDLGNLVGLMYDERLMHAQNNHQAIVETFPRAEISSALRSLAHACLDWVPLGASSRQSSSSRLTGVAMSAVDLS